MEPYVETNRLILRKAVPDHLDLFWPYVSNPEISENMSWHAHTDRSQTLDFLKRVADEFDAGCTYNWSMFTKPNEVFCGCFGLIAVMRTHRALKYDSAELAYWLGPEFRGNGYVTEAGAAIIDLAFDQDGMHRLTVAHLPWNKGSEGVAIRLGFKRIGVFRQAYEKDGRRCDSVQYDMLCTDVRPWQDSKRHALANES
jgi:RimJ/RimL family protein N-acetyltransferase